MGFTRRSQRVMKAQYKILLLLVKLLDANLYETWSEFCLWYLGQVGVFVIQILGH